MITARDFVNRWAQSALREQQAAQSHFNELCELVGHKTPAQMDPEGVFFTFEEQVSKATGGRGRADVWYQGHFAWEYKGKHRDLDAAYAQLLAYKGGLDNPPLLVVCDFLEYRIYPQWPNTSGLPFVFRNEDLLDPKTLRYITWLLENPQQFLELRQTELEQREKLTLSLAYRFAHLADLMRQHRDASGQAWAPMQIARFLTKLVFALFAEDIELLPRPFGQPMFRFLVEGAKEMPEQFVQELRLLFEAMDGQRAAYIMQPVPYFNGGLFAESSPGAGDGYEVLDLTQIPGALDLLGEVSEADWRFVNPTIFGTLFEGALDASKRAQLGAHYTGEDDIRLVVEPVLMQPLYREWEAVRHEAEPLLQTFLRAETPRATEAARQALTGLYDRMMNRLESTRVLDPACGSGNFLYVSLRALKDLEGRVRKFFEPLGLPFRDVVTPRQLYGIEKDEFAANLAHVVVWIGYLQWRYEDEGILHPVNPRKQTHPRALPHPILQDKNSPDEPDRIVCADAILRYDAAGQPYEPDWPEVDVIMGNPPFLGGQKILRELGEKYAAELRGLYGGRIHASADLVTYWYERAREHIQRGKVKRAGFLATQAIRAGVSRQVLDRIKQTGDIFLAWSDRPWTLDGAAVRVSMVGFDDGQEKERYLNGEPVAIINSDLTTAVDLTTAKLLPENSDLIARGIETGGPFELEETEAIQLRQNPHNWAIIVPIINARDITSRPQRLWVIDFEQTPEIPPEQYPEVFELLRRKWDEALKQSRHPQFREDWWRIRRSGEKVRTIINKGRRYVCTPRVAKHRIFTWVSPYSIVDSRIFAIDRDDDYFFGCLHSGIHELWSLATASRHGVGNDPTYNAQSCFETFPFPWPPGHEETSSAAYQAISRAAQQLHAEREAWLNPPELLALGAGDDSPALRERTLTTVYNALAAYRNPAADPDEGKGNKREQREGKPKRANGERLPKAAREFAPRLAALHEALDRAVLAAYGWDDLVGRLRTAAGDEELLRRLLALNLQRAGSG